MLFHVVHEVVEEFDLLLQHGWVLLHGVVMLMAFKVDVMNIAEKIEIYNFFEYIYYRVRSRFFDQVGHQTTNASTGNK